MEATKHISLIDTIEATMVFGNDGVGVQLIVSGVGGSRGEFSGADGVTMCHVYAACLPPYALGVPRANVQLYRPRVFHRYKENVKSTILKISSLAVIVGEDGKAENVFPGEVAEGEEFFDYFWDIFSRSATLEADVPLTKCEIRIISGHGTTAVGNEPAVLCGTTVVPFSKLEVMDKKQRTQRNASVLTVLDCCLSPQAVHALKSSKKYEKVPEGEEFVGVNFPVVCANKTRSYCFRVSWEGHRKVKNKKDDRFAPPGMDGMSEPIGFPIICSLMYAVKARYFDHDPRDLGPIFEEQYRKINRRYYPPSHPFSQEPFPHHQLDKLQNIIGNGTIQLKAEAFDCLLYTRNDDWFVTLELTVSLAPVGEESADLAETIVKFVRQQVMRWHSENKREHIWVSSDASDFAWQRLLQAMGIYSFLFTEFSVTSTGGRIQSMDEELNEDGFLFRDWATSCETLPGIVDKVIGHLEDNKGKTLWAYAGVGELELFEEQFEEHTAQGVCPQLRCHIT